MLKDPRNLLWLLPLAVLATLPLWKPMVADFLSPERRNIIAPVPALSGSGPISSSAMQGVQFEQTKNGTREWLLTAGRLYSRENEADMELEDVRALFFGIAGKNAETRIHSKTARYNADAKLITLKGDVVIRDDKGYEMQTESLEYLAAEKKIRTTAAVSITGENMEVSGNQLLYDVATGNYRLAGNIVCRIW